MGRVVVLMGVSGVGKTTVGRILATDLHVPFLDADDYHDAESIALMHAGRPLDTAHRLPWLDRVNAAIRAALARSGDRGAVVACSALTDEYRQRLVTGLPEVTFVVLTGSPALLRARLERRRGHFAGVALLPSQLATLQPPTGALVEDVTADAPSVAARIVRALEAPPADRTESSS